MKYQKGEGGVLNCGMKKIKTILLASIIFLVVLSSGCAGNQINIDEIPISGSAKAQDAPVQQTGSVSYIPMVAKINPWTTLFGIESMDAFDKVALTGAQWLRINPQLNWAEVEEIKGTYTWNAQLDSAIIDASSKGLKNIVLTISHAPAWARNAPSDPACGPFKEQYFSAYADFLKKVVQKYSYSPYNVKYFMLWNEPDASLEDAGNDGNSVFGCWGEETYAGDPYHGGEYYGKMLKVVYPTMKEANPLARVVLGGLLLGCDPREEQGGCQNADLASKWNFFEGVIKEAGNSFDVVAFHAYVEYADGVNPVYQEKDFTRNYWAANGGVINGKIDYLRDVMQEYGYDKPIMVTENALLSRAATKPANFENAKADYLVWTYANTWSQGITANIWYTLRGWNSSELIDQNDAPLPAYTALQTMSKTLSDTEYVSKEVLTGYTKFIFKARSGQVWLLVPTGKTYGASYSITKPANLDRVTSINGDNVTGIDTVITFTRPVYLFVK